MSDYRERWIEVFIKDHDDTETCNLGHKHIVRFFASKQLGPAVGTREYDNGYSKQATDVRQDRQGRWYHQHPPMDFHGSTSWVRDDDNAHFYMVPVFGGKGVVHKDMVGRILTYSAGRIVRR